ncbi:hypothetical protein CN138_09135 [Sinorhizobium meliloti]|uniref:phage adaptor protein n=1 Tax=Rhizobium meliloti TaxID=382 RepID=UPI000FD2BEE8|nr:hypothetical protein [Sinorhizobium meliloti]RVL48483.1 hypothetical protein CN145_23260 [Sinorhizobium meliloti]RVL72416.1 hypothetical protein CN138_09135 [Sinorhizobium meliloti]
MTIATIVSNATDRIAVSLGSAAVFSNPGETARQMRALANQEGKELMRRGTWEVLTKETTFTAIAQETQTDVIPDDFDHMLNETFYNRTRKRQVVGPLTPKEWQEQKSIVATVLYDSYRIRGGSILMIPVPSAGDEYAFEYVSNQWVLSTDEEAKTAFTTDSDTPVLDEELITLGVIWRFLKAKGFDYAEAFRTYELQVSQALGRDGSKRTVNFAQRIDYGRPRYPGIQDGNWNL